MLMLGVQIANIQNADKTYEKYNIVSSLQSNHYKFSEKEIALRSVLSTAAAMSIIDGFVALGNGLFLSCYICLM